MTDKLKIIVVEEVSAFDLKAICAHLANIRRRFPNRQIRVHASFAEIKVTIGPEEVV